MGGVVALIVLIVIVLGIVSGTRSERSGNVSGARNAYGMTVLWLIVMVLVIIGLLGGIQ